MCLGNMKHLSLVLACLALVALVVSTSPSKKWPHNCDCPPPPDQELDTSEWKADWNPWLDIEIKIPPFYRITHHKNEMIIEHEDATHEGGDRLHIKKISSSVPKLVEEKMKLHTLFDWNVGFGPYSMLRMYIPTIGDAQVRHYVYLITDGYNWIAPLVSDAPLPEEYDVFVVSLTYYDDYVIGDDFDFSNPPFEDVLYAALRSIELSGYPINLERRK